MSATVTESTARATGSSMNPRRLPRPAASVSFVRHHAGLILALIAIILLFVVPCIMVVVRSFSDPTTGIENYVHVFQAPVYRRVIENTLISAGLCTVICVLVAYPVAYAGSTFGPRARLLILGLVLFAYASGTVPRAFAWLVVLGDRGLVNSFLTSVLGFDAPVPLLYNQFGVIVGMVHAMLPFTVLLLVASMSRVNASLVPAARTLGASGLRAFLTVYLPLTRSGVMAAGMLIFIYSLGFYVVPAVLGGPGQTTVVMSIQSLTLNLGQWGLGSALATIVSVVAAGGAYAYLRITRLSSLADEL